MREVTSKVDRYLGRDAFSEITNIAPGSFRSIKNIDLFSSQAGDFLKNRRGSAILEPESATPNPGIVKSKTVFSVDGEEYLVTTQFIDASGTYFYSQKLTPSIGNPVRIRGQELVISAGLTSILANVTLDGLTLSNTTNWVVFVRCIQNGTDDLDVLVYNNSSYDVLIASGNATVDGAFIALTEQNTSGVSGRIQVLDVNPGSTNGNIAYASSPISVNEISFDMKNANEKIYAFAQDGNKILEWREDEERFAWRPMGLEAPTIQGFQLVSGTMPENGAWYYGLEKVYRRNGADITASSPNRRWGDGTVKLVAVDANNAIDLNIGTGPTPQLEDDPYWTHLRLWRSKSAVVDISDPLYPVDSVGRPDHLFEVALITREEMFSTYAPIATNDSLPAGNANVSAGLDGPVYKIGDNNDDSVLDRLLTLDFIDLVPMPPARTGAVQGGRIFVSGVNQNDIDNSLKEDVLYSNLDIFEYQEQWDPQAFLDAGRNSFKTTMLLNFNGDLLVFREGETKYVPQANIDAGIKELDGKIGILSYLMAGFVPGVGICAICSDKRFRIFGFDYIWRSNLGQVEVSNSIYDITSQSNARAADFVWLNGKIMMLVNNGPSLDSYVLALHAKEGKGWTDYEYLWARFDGMFSFGDFQRAAIIPNMTSLLEIEVDSDEDQDPTETVPTAKVSSSYETHAFRPESGGMMDIRQFSFWGKLTENASITAKSSNRTWETRATFENPGLHAANPELNEREYRFEPQPRTEGAFQWVPLRGAFISFLFETTGEFMLSWQKIMGLLRETKGNLGVFQSGGIIPQGPGWSNSLLLQLNFEDPSDTFYDASGKAQNYAWAGSGTKTNRVNQKPGKGLLATGGAITLDTDTVSPLIGESGLTFKAVFSLQDFGDILFYGRSGQAFYSLRVSYTQVVMTISDGSRIFSFTSNYDFNYAVVYVLTFSLSKDLVGQFYYDHIPGFFGGARAATKTIPTTGTLLPYGWDGSGFSNITLGGTYAGQPLYGTIQQAFPFWKLYPTPEDRDADTNSVGYFNGPPTGDTYSFFPLNGSGITGTMDAASPSFPDEPEDLDIVSTPAPTTEGARIEMGGIVSYFSVEKTSSMMEQAKRFLGMVKAYG